ncbi:FtsB family cell division protein, partial [Actinomyces slackii]
MTPRRPSRSSARRGSRGSGTHPGQSSTPARGTAEQEAPETAAPMAAERSIPPRVVMLVVVSLLAFALVFTSLRAYLSQRAQYDDVVDRLARAQATSTALERELSQWEDEDYVRSQVRERLGYVMPGETTYVVVGAEKYAEDPDGQTAGESSRRAPWYDRLRESARLAGEAPQSAAPEDPAKRGWAPPEPSDGPQS